MMQSNGMRLAAAAALAAVLLAVFQNAVNLKKIHRGRQSLLPVAAVVYAAAGIAALYAGFEYLAGNIKFLDGTAGAASVVMNLVLAAGFLLVKMVLCPVVFVIWKNNRLMELFAASFYEYDDPNGVWFLKKEWTGLRSLVKAFFWCSAGLSAVLLFVSAITWNGAFSGSGWFPFAATLVIGEVLGFLDGDTREEYAHSVSGTGTDFRRIGHYYRIREIYEKLFPQQFLSSHSGCEYAASQGAENLLKKLEEGDPIDKNTAAFFRSYDRKTAFDSDCIQAVTRLMHGENVVFFQPFYRDLEEYLTYPLVDTLLKGKRCLIIAGRNSTSHDAENWIRELLCSYTRLKSMWRMAHLDGNTPDCEVGILDFCQLYDTAVAAANREFLHETGFVLMLEPSHMVNTGQVGISLLAEEMKKGGSRPVYCICDRRIDGLVDTVSHVLQTEFTNVSAMPVPRCIYTGMTWKAGGDYIRQRLFDRETRFLGNGVELAAAAVRNKIPEVIWYGETRVPLRDIRWIAGQYYSTICRYMNLPVQQKTLYEKLKFVPGLWTSRAGKEQFVIVEDEFSNMFSTMRAFLTRGKEQSFVNVFSEDYMLRDYMRFNQQIFLTDPEAVPSLAPDYAKTDRNVLIKLLLMMTVEPLTEQQIRQELELAGCAAQDVFATLTELLTRYTDADNSIITVQSVQAGRGGRSRNEYSIPKETFDSHFKKSLKHAYYVVEEEEREKEYVDAKFFGHITQTILPGQFVVYNGKYYEVHEISPDYGIVLRRASDLYTARRYYRQLRTYQLEKFGNEEIVNSKNVMGMKLTTCCCDFSAETDGYLDMQDLHDLQTAKCVDLRDDPQVRNYSRSYRNKRILKMELPGMDAEMRYTTGLLLSELFRSLYPEGWPYLVVLAKKPESLDEKLGWLTYNLSGAEDQSGILIMEDSELDLGLLDSVLRNLPRMFEILDDFLSWHLERLEEQKIYQKEHFFLFGADHTSAHLKLEEVRDYFQNCGYGSNPLTRARKRDMADAGTYDLQTVNTCDFCGLPLADVSYERLTDGRIRCNDCAASAVETAAEFEDIFYRSLNMMEILYGMKIHAPIQVRVADAKEVARRSGMVFKPGSHFAVRAVGYAQKKNGTYRIVVENGSPRLAAIETMVHELTHIWQYLNWKDREVKQVFKMEKKAYTAAARDILYEGMAIWASVQYLYQMGETYYASSLERTALAQCDARGAGFRLYAAQYPLIKDMTAMRSIPFTTFPPVDPELVKEEVQKLFET